MLDLQSGADDSSAPLGRSTDSSYPPRGADEKITENMSFHLEVIFLVDAAVEIEWAPAVLAVLFQVGRLPREMRSRFVGEER